MATGTFTNHPRLKKDLPRLVKQQQAAAARIAVDPADVKAEKAIRAAIDALLIADDVANGDQVTCNGCVVTHVERAGQSRLDPELVHAYLLARVDAATADALITAWTITGDPAVYCTVKAEKGAP
jgi:hypothetical protein